MSTQNLNAYVKLGAVYDDAGFSNYAAAMTPELLTYLQQTDWLGRRILDLGCGTGQSTAFFSSRGMDATGIDYSPHMLAVANKLIDESGYHAHVMEGDIREIDYPGGMDLVFCIGGVLNELMSLREIGVVFQKAYAALEPGRRLVFDMITLRGLGEYLGNSEQVLNVSEHLFLTVQNRFTFDTMTIRQSIICFHQAQNNSWERFNVHFTLRAYPHTSITNLLTTTGFEILGAYDTNLQPFDPLNDAEGRVIVIAQKKA